MEFTLINETMGTVNEYLDISTLQEGVVQTKVCLMTDASTKLDKFGNGYVRYYVKDQNGQQISAILFNVKEFSTCGLVLAQLKGKPVMMKFVPQVYNGQFSLIVDEEFGLQEYTGEFEYDKFVGKIDFDEVFLDKAGKSVYGDSWSIPLAYKTLAYSKIGHGKVGAFCKIMELTMKSVAGSKTLLGTDYEVLKKAFFVAMETVYRTIELEKRLGNLKDAELFDIVMELNRKYRDDENYLQLTEVIRAMAGYGEAKTLFSRMIKSAYQVACDNLDIICTYQTIPVGTSTIVGGVELLKN